MKTKAPKPTAAANLYRSPLFLGRRRYVERTCDCWFVLSAKFGLLEPAEVVAPYDETLTTRSLADRRKWSAMVLDQITARLGTVAGETFEVHAGAAYRDFGLVGGLDQRGALVVIPARGLRQGDQLRFYRDSSSR